MPVFWFYCRSCGIKFSWVFDGLNDCYRCPKCRSTDISRVVINWKEIQKELVER